MAARTIPAEKPATQELVITRVFDAPRELVFQAWTEPDRARQWWAPHGFTVVLLEMDVRPGGAWRKCMCSPDGTDYWRRGVFRDIAPPERLVFTYHSDDRHSRPEHETVVTITFVDRGGKTEMTFHQAFFKSLAERDAHLGGWSQGIERLAEYVARQGR